jgi:hypothetical protein
VLHADLAAVVGAERFAAEIRVTARLQHPHVLGLIDSGVLYGVAGLCGGRVKESLVDQRHNRHTSVTRQLMPALWLCGL